MESSWSDIGPLPTGSQVHDVYASHQHIDEESGDDASDDTGSHRRHSVIDDQVIFDEPPQPLSPDTSPQRSEDEVSVLLSSHKSSQHTQAESPFTPMSRPRFAFRNSSYVRAMQHHDNSPPHYQLGSPATSQQRINRFPTPTRNSTPRSVRSSRSARNSVSPSKKLKKEYPLVLLHVTVLPISQPYSQSVMERVLPAHVIANWKLLHEKTTSTILERGILIPHPREDYEMLEERLLESLELALPRILKCGHFHLSEEESEAILEAGEDTEVEKEGSKDIDICPDCDRRIRDGRFGTGEGNRRWDIKIYAANGLMRSGAWSAAWREMERVDAGITPWLGDSLRRDLEAAAEEERMVIEEQRRQEVDLDLRSESRMDEERMKEIYGDGETQEFVDGLPQEQPRNAPPFSMATPSAQDHDEIPLTTLLQRYVQNLAQDPKNVAIGILSLLLVFLAVLAARPAPPSHIPLVAPIESVSSILHTAASSVSTSVAEYIKPSEIRIPQEATPSMASPEQSENRPKDEDIAMSSGTEAPEMEQSREHGEEAEAWSGSAEMRDDSSMSSNGVHRDGKLEDVP